MPEQLELLEPPPPPPPAVNRLFLALFPDAGAGQQISAQVPSLRNNFRVTGKLRPEDHRHMTLHWFDDYPEIPAGVVKIAGNVSEAVTSVTAPVDISLDRVMSFRGRPGSNPFVLVGDESPDVPVMKFHQLLSKELLKQNCRGKGSSRSSLTLPCSTTVN